MKSNLLVAIAAISLSGFAYAAESNTSDKPPSGSATTEQESPSHPAAAPSTSSAEKTGAGTTVDQSPNHPATKGDQDSGQAAIRPGAAGVRDWATIDENRDNSISPDEMQKFLEKSWADGKKSG